MAVQTPVISYNKITKVLSGTGGGTNSSMYHWYYYVIYTRLIGGTVWVENSSVQTNAASFTKTIDILYGNQVMVKQLDITVGTPYGSDEVSRAYSGESNILTVARLQPPSKMSYDPLTNTFSWFDADGNIASFNVYRDNGSAYSLLANVVTTATSGSLVLDSYLTESADLMVRTVETDGSMSADSEIVHVVVEDSTVQSGYSVSFDEILISINSTVSLVSDMQEWLESLYSGTISLSEVFVTIAEEDLLSGNTPGDLIADIQDYLESIISESLTGSLVVETQTFVGKLEELTGIELTSSQVEDVQLYVDQLVSNNVSQSLVVDIREHVEGLLSVDVTQSIEVDEQEFIGNLEVVLGIELSQSQVEDIQEYVESVVSANATLSLVGSIQDYLEAVISQNATRTVVIEAFFGIGRGHKKGSAYRISELPSKYSLKELPPKYVWKELA